MFVLTYDKYTTLYNTYKHIVQRNTIKNKIESIKEDNNLSINKLSELIKVPKNRLESFMYGRIKDFKDIEIAIAKHFPQYFTKINNIEVQEPQEKYKAVPFIGQEISATATMAMADAMPINDDTYVRLPMFTRAEFILPVRGHSMKGYIDSGDFIAVRRITNIELIIYGEPYVVITRETNMRTVKFVNQHEDLSKLWLSPYNTEQFNSQSIAKSDVLEMYVVLGKLKDLNI